MIPGEVLTVECTDANGFTVRLGDLFADHLTFDEALASVASALVPKGCERPAFLQTAEEHERWSRSLQRDPCPQHDPPLQITGGEEKGNVSST